MQCGATLAPGPDDQARLTRLMAALPAPLAAKVRAAAGLTGERRVVTALLVELADADAIRHQLGREPYDALLTTALDRLAPAIFRYEGTIARLMGDALLAFFGAPVAHEDDPLRAVHAALDLVAAARAFAPEAEQRWGVTFRVRACLSSGPVVIGPVGSDLVYDYGDRDQTVVLIAFVAADAPPMEVQLTEQTYRFVNAIFNCVEVGLLVVPGHASAVRTYQVYGLRAAPGSLRGLAGLHSPMVGRTAELAALLELSAVLEAGLGRAALIIGEPGLGKSRLINEWRTALSSPNRSSGPSSGFQWFEAHCSSYGQNLAYHLAADLVRSLCGLSPTLSGADARTALADAVAAQLADDGAAHLPFLAQLAGVALSVADQEELRGHDPQSTRTAYLAALRALIEAAARRKPLVVVLEDVHWADPSSSDLLAHLLTLAAELPLLFCISCRAERDAPGWRLVSATRELLGDGLTELTLTSLSDAEGQQLVANLLAINELPRPVHDLILHKADGNPFFVEEVIRMLVERGAIVNRDGRWIATGAISLSEIPDNLQSLLLARIDRLPDEIRYTLRVAAVIGRQFPVRVLEHVLGHEAAAGLRGQLNTLEATGLVRLTATRPDLEYLFRHTLVHEAAYSSLLDQDRRRLHLAVGEALETLYSERREILAPRLAHHFCEAGVVEKAFEYHHLAGDVALSACANQEAERHYRAAPLGEANPEGRAHLSYMLGRAVARQSRHSEAIQIFYAAVADAQAAGNLDLLAYAYASAARSAWYEEPTSGLPITLAGLAAVAGAPESPGQASLIHEAGRAYYFSGEFEHAELLCRQALDIAGRLGDLVVQAEAMSTLGLLPTQPPERALSRLRRAVELAEEAGLPATAARANLNLGGMLIRTVGDLRGGREHARRAQMLARRQGTTQDELLFALYIADLDLMLGDFATLEAALPALRTTLRSIAHGETMAFELGLIEAQLALFRDEYEAAITRLEALRITASAAGQQQLEVIASLYLAEALADAGRIEEAGAALATTIGAEMPGDAFLPIRHTCKQIELFARLGYLAEAHSLRDNVRAGSRSGIFLLSELQLTSAEALLALAEQRFQDAIEGFAGLTTTLQRIGMVWQHTIALADLAEALQQRGAPADLERARGLFQEAAALFERFGAPRRAAAAHQRAEALSASIYSQALAHQQTSRELTLAAEIQAGLLPADLPSPPGWQLAALLMPARETAGDFYDCFSLPGGQLGIVIADVADKGVAAALYMALGRTLIRTLAGEYADQPARVLSEVNRRMLHDTHADLFITAFYGVLDPTSGELSYCNAGHNPPLVVRQSGQIDTLGRTGIALGVIEEMIWEYATVQIAPGDLLLLYTDGITEAQNKAQEFFGNPRLYEVARAQVGAAAPVARDALLAAVRAFAAGEPQSDDIALMAVVRSGAAR